MARVKMMRETSEKSNKIFCFLQGEQFGKRERFTGNDWRTSPKTGRRPARREDGRREGCRPGKELAEGKEAGRTHLSSGHSQLFEIDGQKGEKRPKRGEIGEVEKATDEGIAREDTAQDGHRPCRRLVLHCLKYPTGRNNQGDNKVSGEKDVV